LVFLGSSISSDPIVAAYAFAVNLPNAFTMSHIGSPSC
jgi:hypothetical protein